MKYLLCLIWGLASLSGCAFNEKSDYFTNSSIQSVDMGKFNGLRIIEITGLNYPENPTLTPTSQLFTDKDKDNFEDSIIQSLKRSDVRVLPSAQTKIHINFTKLILSHGEISGPLVMAADVVVSRNGIVSRKSIEISSDSKLTLGATKDNCVKLFILELADVLREQSSFKS